MTQQQVDGAVERVRAACELLDNAAMPTKCEVFTVCGGSARQLHDDLSTLLSTLTEARAERDEARKWANDFWHERQVRAETAEAERDGYRDRADTAEAMLVVCEAQFRFYARSHRAKQTPDADAKAAVNEELADRIAQALQESGSGSLQSRPLDQPPAGEREG